MSRLENETGRVERTNKMKRTCQYVLMGWTLDTYKSISFLQKVRAGHGPV
jgi:hypothetical protein